MFHHRRKADELPKRAQADDIADRLRQWLDLAANNGCDQIELEKTNQQPVQA